eukprot:jgi/Picre1/31624/NNA_006975.t1
MPKAEKRSQNGDKAHKNVEFARPSSTQRKRFKQHLSKKKVAEGLKNGTLFEATIRYNASDRDAGFWHSLRGMLEEVSLSGPEKIHASGIERIRHTLENERCGWRATGEVVYIKNLREKGIHGWICEARERVGILPSDSRLPKGYIENTDFKCDGSSRGIVKNMENYYEASIIAWNDKDGFPRIKVKSMLGKPGTLETDIQALLKAEKIDDGDLFDEEVLKCLPETPWRIPQNEYSQRRDLRAHRIFSIDPETAKDLDDALSIEPLEHGKYRIGVHIADVSYFVKTGSKLDELHSRGLLRFIWWIE